MEKLPQKIGAVISKISQESEGFTSVEIVAVVVMLWILTVKAVPL
ncbi:hypothetical protein [Bacillus sp. THAF10]|nr:hypothetical protein [Bacillus sp. THAF10]